MKYLICVPWETLCSDGYIKIEGGEEVRVTFSSRNLIESKDCKSLSIISCIDTYMRCKIKYQSLFELLVSTSPVYALDSNTFVSHSLRKIQRFRRSTTSQGG